MTLEISASKLCKARLCGKWAYPTRKAGVWRSPSSDTTKAILDGNLRHAVMEFYLKSNVAENLLLDNEDILEMLGDDKIDALISFLEESPEKYPSELKIESQRMANRLANVVGQLGASLTQTFGKLVSAYSELKIGGKSIQLSPSFVLNHGEVDAVFVFENNGNRSIIIVDWKRNIGDSAEEYYTSQLFTYARCLVERPELIDLHDITAEEIFVMLVEIGNNEKLDFNPIFKQYNGKKLVGILDSALKNIETNEPQAGGHCSSRCIHAFNFKNPCRAFTPDGDYLPNLTIDDFWVDRKYADRPHYSMIQIRNGKEFFMQKSKQNTVETEVNGVLKKIYLRNVPIERSVSVGDELRIEGSIRRISRHEVEIFCSNILIIAT